MPNTIKTVADLRAHLALMHATALTNALTKAAVIQSKERMVLK